MSAYRASFSDKLVWHHGL